MEKLEKRINELENRLIYIQKLLEEYITAWVSTRTTQEERILSHSGFKLNEILGSFSEKNKKMISK
jgi:uncharacterized coiled-coil protein SlyX